ncbi:MAG TPA: periplasmic heavy metal sensor [Bacteroidota bacterium]|nr:periplasmic heavy metal sensor [Bacteroidota bacterium]
MKRQFVALVLGLALVASTGFAQPDPGGKGPAGQNMRRQMVERLNLTDQQKQEIGKLRAEFQKTMIANRAKVQSLRVDLRTEIAADNPDRGAIEKTTQAISSVQAQMKMDLIGHLFAVRALLTPDQQKIFKNELMQIGGRMHQMVRNRMMGGMGARMGGRMGARGGAAGE